MEITRIPLGSWIESGLTWLTSEYSVVTRGISRVTQAGINSLNDGLMWLPEWALLAIIALLCWKLASTRLAIGAVAGLALIWNLGLWNPMIETLTLVVIATLVAVVIALPVGIAAALSERLYRVIMPVLDFMQTMPAFVYLIPAIPFFGIGSVSAIFAARHSLYHTGHPPSADRTHRSCRRLRCHARPKTVQSAVAAVAAHGDGGHQPNHHAGTVDGGHRRHDRCRRPGQRSVACHSALAPWRWLRSRDCRGHSSHAAGSSDAVAAQIAPLIAALGAALTMAFDPSVMIDHAESAKR